MFNKNLKRKMAEKEITQVELSKMAGISKASISQYLAGKNEPSSRNMKSISEVLECSVDDLTMETPENVKTDEMSLKNIPIEEAARRMGKSPQFVRVCLQRGIAPFGFAVQISGKKWTYHISPKLLNEYLGTEDV